MTATDLRDWAALHFRATVTARRQIKEYQPMVAYQTPDGQEQLGVLALSREEVGPALSALVREHRAQCVAVMMDTWVGNLKANPDGSCPSLPPGQRVRDLPSAEDALVVAAMLPTGLTGMWMARYTGEGEALHTESPEWYLSHVFSHMLPTPWADRS